VIDDDDALYEGPGKRLGEKTYEALLEEGDPEWDWQWPADEWQAISLNYTSGTTGNPKGVVYHHRGAYLNGVGNILVWGMPHHSVYLWTLPMFHCNGWCFPWTMAANAGTSVCLRKVDPALIFDLIRKHRVTHYCGAPIVHQTLINAPPLRKGIDWTVNCLVAAQRRRRRSSRHGEDGLLADARLRPHRDYGPATVCAKQPDGRACRSASRCS
jgi:fatty-acyl-CoA synthase